MMENSGYVGGKKEAKHKHIHISKEAPRKACKTPRVLEAAAIPQTSSAFTGIPFHRLSGANEN